MNWQNDNRCGNLHRRVPGRFATGMVFLSLLMVSVVQAETPMELLAKAAWEVRVFSFDKAYRLFTQVMEQTNEGADEWQQAVFGAGITIQLQAPPDAEKLAKAQELYGLLIKKTPQSRYIPRAMMNLGRIAELRDFFDDKINLEEARRWYQRVVENHPNDKIANEAMFRIAATYIQTYDEKQVQKGIKILKDWLKKHPGDSKESGKDDNPMASGMWQYLGDTYFYPLNDYRNSLECYIKADGIGLLEKGREGPVYWRMAVMADRIKDRENAVKYYTKIITLVPTSGKAYESQLALKKLGAPVPKLEMFAEMMGSPVPGETIPTADALVTPPTKPAGAKTSDNTKKPQGKEGQK